MRISDSNFLQYFNEKSEIAWNSFFSEMYIPLKNYAKRIVIQSQIAEDKEKWCRKVQYRTMEF